MKRIAGLSLLLGAGLILSLVSCTRAQNQPPDTVSAVNLQRYMGTWYEIASIPTSFQRQCAANTTAKYRLLEDGQVMVVNGCDTAEGERISSEGRARVTDPQSNARLRVTFVNLLGWRYLFGGDYWIIGLDEQRYSYAVVGHPTRRYGWILSRSPDLPASTLKQLTTLLQKQGYDPCDFITTPQMGGIDQTIPLCQYVGLTE